MVVRRRALCAPLVAVLLAGCGGGQAGEPASGGGAQAAVSDGVRQQAESLCVESTGRLEGVSWPADSDVSVASAAPALEETVQIHRGLLDGLAQLPAAGTDRAALDELASAGGTLVDALELMRQASYDGDSSAFSAAFEEVALRAQEAADTAARLGMPGCYVAA